jgi:hypothetical protein
MNIQEKICTICKENKDINLFSNDIHKKDGKRPECKSCKAIRDKKYRESNINKIKEKSVEYYQNNKETIKEKVKLWYDENKEQSKESKAKYYQNNKEKMDLAKKEWHDKNKDKMKIWVNTYMKNRYHDNFDYRIKTIMNKRIRDYIRLKTKPTLEFLGCSIDEFKKWIEYQFNENMNWDNMGSYWSFDHVKPCNSFDFSDEIQILNCYNWTNLRPLKAIENSSKGSKIDNNIIEQHNQLLETYINQYGAPS